MEPPDLLTSYRTVGLKRVQRHGHDVVPLERERTSVAMVSFFPAVVVKQFYRDSENEFEKEKRILSNIAALGADHCFCKGVPIPELAIAMERWAGDLGMFIGVTSEVQNVLSALLTTLIATVGKGFLYTDLKPENVLWRRKPSGGLQTVLCDYSGCAMVGDEWSCQTFPWPGSRRGGFYDKKHYDRTIQPPTEATVVWGFGVTWLILLGYEGLAYEYLSFQHLTQRGLRAFRRLKLPLPPGLSRILNQETTALHDIDLGLP